MRLFCAVGWHRAVLKNRWNGGYYFSRCRNCGRDLVRAPAGRWHIPEGYRVVWKPAPRMGVDPSRQVQERQELDHPEKVRSSPTPSATTAAFPASCAVGEDRPERIPPAGHPAEASRKGDAAFMNLNRDRELVPPPQPSTAQAPSSHAFTPSDPLDDFMNEDSDHAAWGASLPDIVNLPDFERDFMEDQDDSISDRPVPDRTIAPGKMVESVSKAKKVKRARKKAAEN